MNQQPHPLQGPSQVSHPSPPSRALGLELTPPQLAQINSTRQHRWGKGLRGFPSPGRSVPTLQSASPAGNCALSRCPSPAQPRAPLHGRGREPSARGVTRGLHALQCRGGASRPVPPRRSEWAPRRSAERRGGPGRAGRAPARQRRKVPRLHTAAAARRDRDPTWVGRKRRSPSLLPFPCPFHTGASPCGTPSPASSCPPLRGAPPTRRSPPGCQQTWSGVGTPTRPRRLAPPLTRTGGCPAWNRGRTGRGDGIPRLGTGHVCGGVLADEWPAARAVRNGGACGRPGWGGAAPPPPHHPQRSDRLPCPRADLMKFINLIKRGYRRSQLSGCCSFFFLLCFFGFFF